MIVRRSPNTSLQRTRAPRFARGRSPLSSQTFGDTSLSKTLESGEPVLKPIRRYRS